MNAQIRKFARIENDAKLGARQIRIVASDATPDRVGDIMVPEGCDLSEYKQNPIVLAQHKPEDPIGAAKVEIINRRVEALITFAPEGISPEADKYLGLAKSGIINAASVGFDPIESEPIKGGGRRYTSWRLLELSLVSVPANPSAIVIARSARATTKNGSGPFLSSRPRREGTARLSTELDPWLKAWLRKEWPGLSQFDALVSRGERRESMKFEDRRAERRREDKFAAEFAETKARKAARAAELAAMTPDEHLDMRLRDLEALTPPKEPWRWDPNLPANENLYRKRLAEFRGEWTA